MEGRKAGRGGEGWRATPLTLKWCTRRTKPVMELSMILCSQKVFEFEPPCIQWRQGDPGHATGKTNWLFWLHWLWGVNFDIRAYIRQPTSLMHNQPGPVHLTTALHKQPSEYQILWEVCQMDTSKLQWGTSFPHRCYSGHYQQDRGCKISILQYAISL